MYVADKDHGHHVHVAGCALTVDPRLHYSAITLHEALLMRLYPHTCLPREIQAWYQDARCVGKVQSSKRVPN